MTAIRQMLNAMPAPPARKPDTPFVVVVVVDAPGLSEPVVELAGIVLVEPLEDAVVVLVLVLVLVAVSVVVVPLISLAESWKAAKLLALDSLALMAKTMPPPQ